MKKCNRILALLLVFALLVSLPIPWPALAQEASDVEIYDLMTENQTDPVGLDNPAPVFSWKMRSAVIGQRQTAYQLTVKTGETTVWDSGKVASDVSVGIVYGGEALRSSTTYTWSVKVWDKDGKTAVSPEATFEMALLEEDAFADTHYISYQPAQDNTPTVYTIDFDFEITSRVVGFLFGAQNDSEFLMWQFSSYQGIFKPHKNLVAISDHTVNICQTAEDEAFRIFLGNGDKTDEAGAANAGKTYHARIQVDGAEIKTYLGATAQELLLIDTYTHTSPVHLGRMGFRQASGESACIDNLTVVDDQGETVYANSFDSEDSNDFATAKAVITDGRLEVKSGAGVCLQHSGTDITGYTIDWDFEIENIAASLVFGATDADNLMMWQFNSKTGTFVPHKRVSGAFTALTSVKISQNDAAAFQILQGTGSSTDAAANKGITYHCRIQVAGAAVKTWLARAGEELTLIHTYTHTAAIPLGKLGIRQGGSEKSYYDNLVVTDSQGNVVYENTFTDAAQNDIVGDKAEVVDGRLYAQYDSTTTTRGVVIQKSADEVAPPSARAMPAYRKSITVKEGLVSAKLYTAGLGVYESYINGQRVGRLQADGSVRYDELKPGFTQRNLRQFYSTFDVTWMLTQGENVLGGVVTNGWWMHVGSLHKGKETAYLAKLILSYADGTQEIVSTDTSWKAAKYAAHYGTGIYPGERYDATVDQSWMLPGYNDSSWPNVKINTEFTGELVAWDGVSVIVREDLERTPKSITVYQGATGAVEAESYGDVTVLGRYTDGDTISLAAGQTLLVDFGQNASGWEYLELEGKRGTVVTVEHGEWLNEAGGVIARGNDGPGGSMFTTSNRLAVAKTEYVMSGQGVEKYHPSLTFYGFQYIEITATADITVHKLRGQVVTSVHNETASMVTSDADVNQLLSNITWGMYSNYLSIPTDCPQRDERHGWTGDAQVFSQAGTYLTYSKSFLRKYLQDLRDAQRKSDGAYPDIAPYTHDYGYHTNADGSYAYGEVGWGDAGIIIPWYLYMMYGDTAILREHWASMRQYMDVYMESTEGNGPTSGSFDHLTLETTDKAPVGKLLGVAFYAWDALLMVDMAEALGETEAAAHYRAVYQREKEIFQQRYVAEDGTLIRYEQTALLFALYLDLLPNEESREAVTNQLISSIAQYGDSMMTGFLGTSIITNTLTQIGRSDVAYTLLLQHNYPSWLYPVDQGATTMWERWNTYTHSDGFGPASMTSFNHYAYGAVAGWMYKTVAGIGFDEDNPGFKRIVLAPAFDSRLPQVSSTYESVYGTIVTTTDISDGVTTFCATIPANTTAAARIPLAQNQSLKVNGKALSALTLEADGIRYVKTEDGVAYLDAVAGSFTFVISETEASTQTQADWTNHYCQGCKQNVAWLPWQEGLTEAGHYYLAQDMDITTIQRLPAGTTCLHLNGKTLRQTEAVRLFNVAGSTFNIMDHPENRGKLVKASQGIDRGGVLNVVYASYVNIYGGTLMLEEGVTASHGSILYANKTALITMYGGVMKNGAVTLTDAVTVKEGGTIHMDENAKFILHGGSIEGGTTPACGGNVYLKGSARFVMYGGTVSGGHAKSGGNFYLADTATFALHGGTITGGVATEDGGNIHLDSGTVMAIDEDNASTCITLGQAVRGGNISMVGAKLTMWAGELSYGRASGTASTDGGGNLLLDTGSTFILNQDAGKESCITNGRSEAANYGGNVHSQGSFTVNAGKVIRGYAGSAGSNVFCSKGTTTLAGGFVGEALMGVNILVASSGKLKITGSTVSGSLMGNGASRNVVIWDNGTVTVTGGTMIGNFSASGGCINATKGAVVTVTGGNIYGSAHSDIAVALVQADNVKKGTTLNISGGNIGSLYVADNNADYDPNITISGSTVIGKLLRGGDTKPMIAFDLREGAKVTFTEETAGDTFGTGSPDYVESDNDLDALTDGDSLKWSVPERVAVGENTYATVTEALADTTADYITLLLDVTEDVQLSSDAVLDLNGHVLTGDIEIAEGATLYLFDSATADYTAQNRGSIVGAVTGNLATTMNTPASYGHNYKYLTLQETDGSYSAHRIYLSVKSLLLTPVNTGIRFKTVFQSNELVAQYVDGYGVRLADGDHFYEGTVEAGSNEKTVNIGNILNADDPQAENALVQINVSAMITLKNGTVVTSAQASASLQDAVAAANGMFDRLSEPQQRALRYMYSLFEAVMESWPDTTVGNIR